MILLILLKAGPAFYSTPKDGGAVASPANKAMTIRMFNPAHIAVVLSTLMLCILGSRLLRRLPQRGGNRLMIGLALFNIGLYLLKIALICRQPWFNVWEYLPLDLCGVNLFVCLLAALLQKRALYSFLYFIACPAAALALLLPNACFLNCNLFEPVTLIFYLQHSILAIFPLLLILAGRFRPQLSSVWRNAGVFVLSCAIMYGIDKLIFLLTGVRANYFFLVRSPGNPVLDYLWRLNPREFVYALPCLLVLTVINMLMCLPFISKSPHRHTIKA